MSDTATRSDSSGLCPHLNHSTGPSQDQSNGCPVSSGARNTRRSKADMVMRRILLIPNNDGDEQEVHNIFSTSILLSATRCLISYILLPIVTPTLGFATGAAPWVGIPIGLLALIFDVRAIRRFFLAEHPRRWIVTALYLTIMVMVTSLVVNDFTHIF